MAIGVIGQVHLLKNKTIVSAAKSPIQIQSVIDVVLLMPEYKIYKVAADIINQTIVCKIFINLNLVPIFISIIITQALTDKEVEQKK
jgi:hypothetical protein